MSTPKNAKDAIYRCVSSNLLGRSLFNEMLQSLLSAITGVEIRKAFEKNLKGKHLTQELWTEAARLACNAASLADHKGLMQQRRTATVYYRGVPVQVRVSSIISEVDTWIGAKAKEFAVEAGCFCILTTTTTTTITTTFFPSPRVADTSYF